MFVLLLFGISVFPADSSEAAPKVSCEVEVVAQHPTLVTFTWSVNVSSEKAWDACDLTISFQNGKGQEVHAVRQTIGVRAGKSSFSGTDICDRGIWKEVKKYVATLDCVF